MQNVQELSLVERTEKISNLLIFRSRKVFYIFIIIEFTTLSIYQYFHFWFPIFFINQILNSLFYMLKDLEIEWSHMF